MIPPSRTEQRAATTNWPLLWLLALAMLISDVDRGTLAMAVRLLSNQRHLTPEQGGQLSSAFYVTYVLAMFPAGWCAERYGARRVLAIGFAIWSIATLLTGLCTHYSTLLLCRLLLGIGESTTFPCMSPTV